MARDNLSIHLAERPKGDIIPGTTFSHKHTPIPSPESLKDGEILVETLYLSLDPAMRTYLAPGGSYMAPVPIGGIMRGMTVCRVLASRSKNAAAGDYVCGMTGWTEHAVLREKDFEPTSRFPGLRDPRDMLSTLGMTGVTAWYGMTRIGDPKPGELVVVSGAAGATGSVAGQIAKIRGATVVGIAGSDDKCRWLTEELGFDVALNYKAADFKAKFKEATKSRIDVYFDNVGGQILDMCLARAKDHARFVECGVISQYNTRDQTGLRNIANVVSSRIRMEGFIVLDQLQHFPAARADLSRWMGEGRLKSSETVVAGGLAKAEQALVDLYKGINTGKLLVEIKDPGKAAPKL